MVRLQLMQSRLADSQVVGLMASWNGIGAGAGAEQRASELVT